MHYLRIAVLLLAVSFVTQACIFVPVPVGGGGTATTGAKA